MPPPPPCVCYKEYQELTLRQPASSTHPPPNVIIHLHQHNATHVNPQLRRRPSSIGYFPPSFFPLSPLGYWTTQHRYREHRKTVSPSTLGRSASFTQASFVPLPHACSVETTEHSTAYYYTLTTEYCQRVYCILCPRLSLRYCVSAIRRTLDDTTQPPSEFPCLFRCSPPRLSRPDREGSTADALPTERNTGTHRCISNPMASAYQGKPCQFPFSSTVSTRPETPPTQCPPHNHYTIQQRGNCPPPLPLFSCPPRRPGYPCIFPEREALSRRFFFRVFLFCLCPALSCRFHFVGPRRWRVARSEFETRHSQSSQPRPNRHGPASSACTGVAESLMQVIPGFSGFLCAGKYPSRCVWVCLCSEFSALSLSGLRFPSSKPKCRRSPPPAAAPFTRWHCLLHFDGQSFRTLTTD